MNNKKISIITAIIVISIVVFGIFITFSKENISTDYSSVLQQINQTAIEYVDTHVEFIDGSHFATIYKTEIVDDNKFKIIFRDKNYTMRFGETEPVKVPPFEFAKIVEKGDKFIAACYEFNSSGSRVVGIMHFRDVINNTLFFDHYDGRFPEQYGDCKYPDIIKHSFDFDWIFLEVKLFDIREVPYQ